MTERCDHWMPYKREFCARRLGHPGNHYTETALERRRASQRESAPLRNKLYVESGYHAAKQALYARRKADAADNRREKELLGWLV